MAMSICIVIIVGFILGNPALGNAPSWGNSDDDKGYFQTFFVTASLLSLSILFFAAGWYRGAYPWTANIHPSLARAPPGIRIESELAVAGKYIPAELIELQGLKHDRDNVKRKLEEVESRKRSGSSVMKKYIIFTCFLHVFLHPLVFNEVVFIAFFVMFFRLKKCIGTKRVHCM